MVEHINQDIIFFLLVSIKNMNENGHDYIAHKHIFQLKYYFIN